MEPFTLVNTFDHWTGGSLFSLQAWLEPNSRPASLLIMMLTLSTVFSLVFSVIIVALLPSRLRRRPVRNVLAIAAMGALLPGLGPLLLLGMGLVFPWLEKNRTHLQPEHLARPDFASEIRPHSAHFGAGGAVAQLQGRNDAQAMRALLAIEHRHSALSTRLLSQSLGHKDEIVRLLAYNLLERREQAIVNELNKLHVYLTTINAENANLALDAAALHLEFIYLELAQGSLWMAHLEAAASLLKKIGMPDRQQPWFPRWNLLNARVLQLKAEDTKTRAIEQYLKGALDAGCAPARALPWLLEQAWKTRDYRRLEELLKEHHVFSMIPVIGPVVARWNRNQKP